MPVVAHPVPVTHAKSGSTVYTVPAAANGDVNVHHYVHHYHHEEKQDEPPMPVDVPEPPKEPPEPEEPAEIAPACRQLNGDFVDSYESTPVSVSQTGCDVTAKWGP